MPTTMPTITIPWTALVTEIGLVIAAGVTAAVGLKLCLVGIRKALSFFGR